MVAGEKSQSKDKETWVSSNDHEKNHEFKETIAEKIDKICYLVADKYCEIPLIMI